MKNLQPWRGRSARPPIDHRLTASNQALQRIAPQLQNRISANLALAGQAVDRNARLLHTLSYQGVLQRGFAVIRDSHNKPITAIATTKPGAQIDIEMRDGHIQAIAADVSSSMKGPKKKPAVKESSTEGKDQGTLF